MKQRYETAQLNNPLLSALYRTLLFLYGADSFLLVGCHLARSQARVGKSVGGKGKTG